MNTEWATTELDKFIKQTVMRNGGGSQGGAVVNASTNYTSAPGRRGYKEVAV